MNDDSVQIPTKLYKYMWFNPEVTAKDSKYYQNLFIKKQMYFPTVEELNDPYDCYPTFSLDGCTDAQLRELLINRNKDKHSEEDYNRIKSYLRSDECKVDEIYKYNYRELIAPYFKEDRVLSLTSEPNSPLMWAHYSDNYRGFCLELNIKDNGFLKDSAFPICYSVIRPSINPAKLLDNDFEIKSLVATKYKGWEYEKEWRLFGHKIEGKLIQLNKIEGVILGPRISEEDKVSIKNWINSQEDNIKLMCAEFNEENYDISINRLNAEV